MAKATFAVDPQAAAQDLAQMTGININQQGAVVDPGKAAGRARDPRFEQRMAVLQNRNSVLTVRPATVYNFLPIKASINGTIPAAQGGVPAVTGDAPHALRTWDKVDIVPFDTGDDGRHPYEFHPMQVAKAFEDEYPHGGVVALYDGPEAASRPENAARLQKGRNDAVKWMQGQVDKAEGFWNAPNRVQRHYVTNVHRACAERLYALKVMKVLPEWVNPAMELENVPTACRSCGKTPENRGAVKCACGEILDPEQAYTRGVITEEHESLERLTRAQVEKLNLSDFVAETVDEREKRVKAGVPKPLSKAVMRMVAAEQAAQGN